MKAKKRLFPIIVAILLTVSALPVSGAQAAFGADDITPGEEITLEEDALFETALEDEVPLSEIVPEDDAVPSGEDLADDPDLSDVSLEENPELMEISLSDDPEVIQISSAEDWETFCDAVNHAAQTPVNAELTSDVTLTEESSMAGENVENYFSGVFDGNGYTLTLNYVSDKRTAPFKHVGGDAVIKNLRTAGSITMTSTSNGVWHTSGLVSGAEGPVTIKDCTSSVNLRFASGSTYVYAGGFVGHAGYCEDLIIENCTFDGSIGYVDGATSKPGLNYVSGFVVWGDNYNLSIKQCRNIGTVSNVAGYYPITSQYEVNIIENCWYLYPGVDCNGPGTMAVTVSGTDNLDVEVLNTPVFTGAEGNYYFAPIEVKLTPDIPEETEFLKYTVNTGSISAAETMEGTHVLTGFSQNIDISYKVKDVVQTITIQNEDDWEDLCELVESLNGETLLNVELANDISITEESTLLGTPNSPFAGTFDGQGHTLHLQIVGSHQSIAPFAQVADAVIKNLNTDGTVVSAVSNDQCYHHSGLIAGCIGDVEILNCNVGADILFPSGTTKVYSGGFIGHGTRESIRMEGCTFTGSIGYLEDAESKPGLERVGGLIGWGDSMRVVMKDCYDLGTFNNVTELSPLVRGSMWKYQFEDSYYIATTIPNVGESANGSGIAMLTVEADDGVQLTINDDPFYTYKGTDYYVAPVKVTLEPVLTTGKVFDKYIVNNGEITNPLEADGEHEIKNCNLPVVVSRIMRSNEPDYLISNAEDWKDFCEAVNAGGDVILQAALTKDVTLDPDSPAAGNDELPFTGEFDGQGYTLTINYEGASRYAPFLRVGDGAEIKNLHTAGTINITGTDSGINHASGLIGFCPGDVTIQNCISSVNIRYPSGTTNIYAAGFIGHTNSANVVMEDCVFDGSIGYAEGAENKPGLSNVGGLIAWGEYDSHITMKNCLNIGIFEDVANLCPILRNNGTATVTDCYYTYTGIPMAGERVCTDGTLAAAIVGDDDLTVSGEPVYQFDSVNYYSETTPLTFALGEVHQDVFNGYTASSGQISDPTVQEGEHMVSGFTEKTVTVKAHWGEDAPYPKEGFYTPLTIAEGFNKDGVLEAGDDAQVEFFDGAENGAYGYYAIPDTDGSLPIDGMIGTSTGRFYLLSDYAQKNVLVLDKNNSSADIVLDEGSRGAYKKLAFLVTGCAGGGTADVTVHLIDPDDPSDKKDVTLEVDAPDWDYTVSEKETVYNCGRVYVKNHNMIDTYAFYGLYESILDLSGEEYKGYEVTSATVEVKTLSQEDSSTICIFAVSGIDPNTCTVLFEGNGGTVSQKVLKVEPDTEIPLPAPEEREGYAFTGWYIGKTKVGDPGDTYKVYTDVVLRAQWKRLATITVGVFDRTNEMPGQGGTYTFNDEDTTYTAYQHKVEMNSNVKLTATPAEGYVFAGWCNGVIAPGTDELMVGPDGLVGSYDPVVEFTADTDGVICAIFRKADDIPPVVDVSTLQVSVPKERESDRVVTFGDKINVSVKITDADGVAAAEAYFVHLDESGNPSGNRQITLTKQEDDLWTGELEIDDETTPGDWHLTGVRAIDRKEDENYLVNSVIVPPEELPSLPFYTLLDLSAFDYEVRESFMVTFDSCGGSEIAPQRVIEGRAAVQPADPVKEGLRLDRWYSDEGLTNSYSFSTPVTNDLKLYAGWVADMSLGVYNKSNPGGNLCGTIDIETGSHTADVTDVGTGNFAIPEDMVAFTAKPAEGFVFKGWYEGVIGDSSFVEAPTGEPLTEDPTYECIASEAALCAVFECAEHKWEEQIRKATPTTDGCIYKKCSVCGAEETIAPLLQVSNIHLEKTSFAYTGKAIEPKVIVANASEELSADCYTVNYSNNVEAGTGSVKVTLKGDYYEGSKTLKFTIQPVAVDKIKLNRTSMEMATKTTAQLKVTFTPANASGNGVTWTSSNPAVATVDKNGKVSALTRGTATITATSTADKTKKATCKLTVKYCDAYYDLDGTGRSNVTKEMETAINWAADNKITGEKEKFGTMNSMTRGQFVRFLYRYAGNPKVTSAMIKKYGSQFKDVDKNYTHFKAIVWAVSEGLIGGYSDGTFKPNKTLSRNNVATILWKFGGSPKVSNAKNPFKDVKKSIALAWGKSKKIFTADASGNFKPNANCIRGDFAVFLYRYDNKK